jgi:GDPmannose 4,6-dehydratase
MRRALITGITRQYGSYLAELLIAKGCGVHGIIRRASSFNTHRLESIYADPHEPGKRLVPHYGAPTDLVALANLARVETDNLLKQARSRGADDSDPVAWL